MHTIKKTIPLFVFLCFMASCSYFSRDRYLFKVQYNPSTIYNQTLVKTSRNTVTYSGAQSVLSQVTDKGIKNPSIDTLQTVMETVFKSGKPAADGHFPITLQFVKTISSDGQNTIPNGTIMLGHGAAGIQPVFDSIVSDSMSEQLKDALLQTMQGTLAQLTFPDKKVKVGESFSKNEQLSIPVAGVTLPLGLTTNYKLVNILNGIATFSISQAYNLASPQTKYTATAGGYGAGEIQYDLAHNFYLKYQVNSNITLDVKLDSLEINLTSADSTIQTTAISPVPE